MNDTTAITRETKQEPQAQGQAQMARDNAALMPPVNVLEDNTGITLYADMPGVPKDKLSLQVESDTLTIEGEVRVAMPDPMEATYAEVSVPRFRRVFTLSKELDTGRISAELKNGVLKLRIPKAEHAQPRRIAVSAG